MTRLPLVLLPLAAALASPLDAQTPSAGPVWSLETVHVTTPGHPKSVAPGTGSVFVLTSLFGSAFGPIVASDDGTHWIFRASVELHGSGSPTYFLDGVPILSSGQQAPWAAPGETLFTMSVRPDVNDSGEVAFVGQLGGTAPFGKNRCVVLYAGGAFTQIAREKGPCDPPVTTLAGVTWDDDLTTARVTNAGAVSFIADYIDGPGLTGLTDEVVILGDAVFLQETTHGPAGLAGGATDLWQDFQDDNVEFGDGGPTSLVRGYTNGPGDTNQVLAIDGAVVLQEGYPVPGGPFTAPIDGNGIFASTLDGGGNWFARGRNADLSDWLVRSGVVVAFSQGLDETFPGSGEHWGDGADANVGFFVQAGSASGAFLIGGKTKGPTESDAVLVHDDGAGTRSLAIRENAAIDLDENGSFDDDRFVSRFGTDGAAFLADGTILFTATLRDGTGNETDEGVFRLRPCGFDTYGVGAAPANVLDLAGGGDTHVGGVFQAITSHVAGAFTVTGVSLRASSFPLLGGVALLEPTALVTTAVATPSGGTATQLVPIPNDANLVGRNVYLQSVADDAAQPQGFALSNGLKLTICE